ncbi:ribonucleotide-diphosphate reductase subunit beta [Clostridium massiliodielmoense]|uniref:ribonucleotide-diphosphate reductase subunit beta n=1 Tax=Clostridium massiliodielmoense TaxID=1776385 RepID=UPI000166739B|nr:ribonucleotide-diphosphate reductase subunit beta [Clostridium massiliodielmoense]EDS77555.1 ribonucleoside-diphosphate reductase, beta subunit [Clostridium botulinum C str. Eklund]NEZ48516.1 ribonucleotide-diphosphate reductase subunit beta [Clostridium botulinum]
MLKKMIFNENGNRGTESIINGSTTNLREWNRIKYNWANELYRNMLNNFWIPEEISLNEDVKQFSYLTDGERNAFDKIISFLNFLDSIQSENLPNISRYITAPEVSSILNIQAFQEEIHAQSYSYILDTVTNPITRDKIYDQWREDKNLLERNKFIAGIYQRFNENPTTENFLRTIMANYILEGIYFYSGFSFFYTLARQGKMTATSTIFKYINRDEITHLILFQNIIKELKNENLDIFTESIIEEFRMMMKTGVEHEIKWGQYVTNNEILGINNNLIEKYIKYLSNLRLNAIGLEVLYPEITEHPMEWIENFSKLNNTKTDFFEAKVTNYTKAAAFDFDDLV